MDKQQQQLIYQNDGLSFKSIRDKLASLDLYPKTLEDFRIKTLGGATGLFVYFSLLTGKIDIKSNRFFSSTVTFLSCSIIAILFLLELNYYLTPYTQEELMIDISSGQKLRISFDITFPHVGCSRKHSSMMSDDFYLILFFFVFL